MNDHGTFRSAGFASKRSDRISVLLPMLEHRQQGEMVDRCNSIRGDGYECWQSWRRRQVHTGQKHCERGRAAIDRQKDRNTDQGSKVCHFYPADFHPDDHLFEVG